MELKSCPFCGSDAKIDNNGNGSYWGKCENDECLCQLGCEDNYEDAVAAWNTRNINTTKYNVNKKGMIP
jgi:hypothetical protein